MRSELTPPVALRAPDPLGQAAQISRVSTFTLTLDTALDLEEFDFSGRFLWAIDGDPTALITLRFSERQTQGIPFSVGQSITGFPFESLFVSSDAQAGLSITLLYSDIPLQTESPARFTATVTAQPWTTNVINTFDLVGAGAQQLFAADPSRVAFTISLAITTARLTLKEGSAPTGQKDGMLFDGSGTLGAGNRAPYGPFFVGPLEEWWIWRTATAFISVMEHFR